jgi:hypothetical protein
MPKPRPSAIQLHCALSPAIIPTLRRDFHGAKLGIVPSTKTPEGELDGAERWLDSEQNPSPATAPEPEIEITDGSLDVEQTLPSGTVPGPQLEITDSLKGLVAPCCGRASSHFFDSMIFNPAVSLVLKVSIVASQSFKAFGEHR